MTTTLADTLADDIALGVPAPTTVRVAYDTTNDVYLILTDREQGPWYRDPAEARAAVETYRAAYPTAEIDASEIPS